MPPKMLRLSSLPVRASLDDEVLSPKWREVHVYEPDDGLVEAVEVAMALRRPLLITGEPGSGKTTVPYWVTWRLGLSPGQLVAAQVRSDSTAAKLRYEFDAVSYFRESQASAVRGEPFDSSRGRFIRKGPLWRAFEGTNQYDMLLLLDEIDKAPRDLPNDLLQEFDEMRFDVPELQDERTSYGIFATRERLRLMVLTSNGERELPDAFLRRCIHHHVVFDEALARRAIERRRERDMLTIAPGLVEVALLRFFALRETQGLRHKPGLAELLVWLEVISFGGGPASRERLESLPLARLPYLGALLKNPADREAVKASGR